MPAPYRRHSILLACLLLFCLSSVSLAFAAASPHFLRVILPGTPAKSVFVKFANGQMWIAATAAGLSKAKPTKASSSSSNGYGYPEVKLPGSGPLQVNARFTELTTASSISCSYKITMRDKAGAQWQYVLQMQRSSATATKPETPAVTTLPAFEDLQVGVETKIDGKNSHIGLRPLTGQVPLMEITRNGAAIPAEVQVLDMQGNVVSTEKGDLSKFGFT
jgi:hypothetical protein